MGCQGRESFEPLQVCFIYQSPEITREGVVGAVSSVVFGHGCGQLWWPTLGLTDTGVAHTNICGF